MRGLEEVGWYGRGRVPSTVELFGFFWGVCVCVFVEMLGGGMTGLAKQRGEV